MELRDIPGQPGYAVGADGSIWSQKSGVMRVMRCFRRGRQGHLGVNLTHGGRYKLHSVHRLVALAWLGVPPSEDHVVMHRDDDPANNAVTNLAYGLPIENSAQMKARGRQARGESAPRSRLKTSQVIDIRQEFSDGIRQTVIARRYAVSPQSINSIVHRQTWRHI